MPVRQRSNTAAETCRLSTRPSPVGAPAPDSAGVTIAEQGWTVARKKPHTGYRPVSIGAVLQNTTDRVAYRIRVEFDALDKSGASLITESQAPLKIIEIPILLPGAKISIGRDFGAEPESDPASYSIKPGVSAWLAPGDAGTGLAPTTAAIDPSSPGAAAARVRVTTQSTNCADMISRGLSFTWRDTTGKIIGGATNGGHFPAACQKGGAARAITAGDDVPDGIDLAKSAVTAFCDVAPGVIAPASGQPSN